MGKSMGGGSLQNLEHILIPEVSWQRTLYEMLAEKGEYILYKAASAIRRSLPDDFLERFSEQDVVNFLIGAAAVGAVFFAYILYRRDKLSSGTDNEI
jgi:hypothetical protein